MKKKTFNEVVAWVMVFITILICCNENIKAEPARKNEIKVGMVTDSGYINDKSFNQGTWEGIERAAEDFNLEVTYIKPNEELEAEYLRAIDYLVKTGFNFIVTPGTVFETAIFKAQEKYKDVKFELIDGIPNPGGIGSGKGKVGENTVSLLFSEQEAGFLAGAAMAIQIKEGKAGFIGGKEILPVQRYNWGFQQGVKYANEKLGTNIEIRPENVIYEGTFNNVEGGKKLAAQMFDRGVKVIFAAAGAVGVGVINEAKARAISGQDVWIIGVDRDQYDIGIYIGGKSVILTSAIKKIDDATYNIIKAAVDFKFPGGGILEYNLKNDGVGIPKENPNLSADTIKKVNELYDKIKSEEIKVSKDKAGLIE